MKRMNGTIYIIPVIPRFDCRKLATTFLQDNHVLWGAGAGQLCFSRGRHLDLECLEPVPGQNGNACDNTSFIEHLVTTRHTTTFIPQ